MRCRKPASTPLMPFTPAEHASPTMPVTALTWREFETLSESLRDLEVYSPLLEQRFLLLDADSALPRAAETLAHRLRRLPVPVIAVGNISSRVLASGVDTIVTEAKEARLLIANIVNYPLAAMTLVQLLRHNEEVTPEQGLLAESLAYASLQGGPECAHALAAAPTPAPTTDEPERAVLMERRDAVLHIVFNRPHARNAYSTALRDGLYEALQLLRMDASLKRAVVSGAGSCFSIGGDLREFGMRPDTATAHAVRSSRNVPLALLELGPRLEFHLHRACIGAGIELPAFAARVVANRNTFVQLPEITLGLLPGAGGTVSIARRIGRQRTAYLALSARRINAQTALRWGLVDAVI